MATLALGLAGAGLSTSSLSHAGIGGIVPPYRPGVHQFDAPQGSGDLTYHNGPVMRTNTTYAIYWLPPGYSYDGNDTGYEDTLDQFFTDVAHDSGQHTNVYSATPQYYDTIGGGTHNIAYSSTFAGSVVVNDTLPADGCSDTYPTTHCLLDSQIQAEIQSVVEANGWPENNSTMYFLFTPPDVGSCFDDLTGCAYTDYCAYHGSFSTGSGKEIIYANQPWTKGMDCEVGEYPNGSDADPTINVVSHEHNEAITDPNLSAWFDAAGYEDGDKCAWGFGPESGPSGERYNQTINGHHYLLQEEFDNSTSSCVQSAGPSLSSFAPAKGKPGTTVTINGTGLATTSSVTIGGVAATFTAVSDTKLTAKVADGTGVGPIEVTTPDGTADSAANFIAAPTIGLLSPNRRPDGGSVEIDGTGLTGATSVKFGGKPVAAITPVSDSELTVTVPAGANSGNVSVTTPGGTVTRPFTVLSITSLAPQKGNVGDTLTINGSGFTGASAVLIAGVSVPGTDYQVISDKKITATIESGTTTGTVEVDTSDGNATSAATWKLIPAIVSLDVSRAAAGGTVHLTGHGFTGATAVKFNGKAATAQVDSDTQITATVPTGATSGKVTVVAPGGTATSATFTIVSIKSFTPATGRVGTTVTILGTGLDGATAVSVSTVGMSFVQVSATKITATAPACPTSGHISVVTPGGTATSAATYTVVGNATC